MTDEPNTQQAPAENQVGQSAPAVPPAHPGFDNAVMHLVHGGFSEDTAKSIVNHVGIDKVLDAMRAIKLDFDGFDSPSQRTAENSVLDALAPDAAKGASEAEAAKEVDLNKPPEPGMKRCPQCGIWYPGGYTHCPHDNQPLS